MKNYLTLDDWQIIEEGFYPEYNRVSESLFSLGNGRMGVRGNFEEDYSGDSLQGSYIGGIYYPEETRWERESPGIADFFTKMPNAANWIGIHVELDGEALDLAACKVEGFRRVLNLREGYLERSFKVRLGSGKRLSVHTRRFCSMVRDDVAAIRYAITPLNFSGTLTVTPYIDLNVSNEEKVTDEYYWVEVENLLKRAQAFLVAETKKTEFQVCTGMRFHIEQGGQPINFNSFRIEREKYVATSVDLACREKEETVVYKYVANLSSLNHPKEGLLERCRQAVKEAAKAGFEVLLEEQRQYWAEKWKEADIIIEGDTAAQQGIRFNIFQLHQTYTGRDDRLNIPPKGFTGERYGGCTYWSAEAFCLPFFMSTAGEQVARNLLLYRYRQLPKAIENAAKLGFSNGAALFPMVTMNGEECSTDWAVAFEEIHRNGAIAYAIFDYVRYTGDQQYLIDYGLEVLIAISRFWAQRVHFSETRQQYVMHGVTGPNEYDNNANNNWYTNYIARWCLQYTLEVVAIAESEAPAVFEELSGRIKFYPYTETNHWKDIIQRLYLPFDDSLQIFPQQDGYLEKELLTVDTIREDERPLYKHWSWDRILRSCFVKRADVLQGLYFFEDHFSPELIQRNFDFYEPRTVHESSLSPCIHGVLAARLGLKEKAYEMYLRTARLDLNDFNEDTSHGCHVTGMAGTWLAVVHGFGGMRVRGNRLYFRPFIPLSWQSYSFKVRFRGALLKVKVDHRKVTLTNETGQQASLALYEERMDIGPGEKVQASMII